jgi:hypothetical protein
MATIVSANRAGSIAHASTVRAVAIECGNALGYELTYKELIRFLPASTIEQFIMHLETVADVEDITEELKQYTSRL